MTENEPTVQVPVSQVTQWRSDLQALLPPGTYAILRELDALLSQPTPTAEPCDREGYDRYLEEWTSETEVPLSLTQWREANAAPPSIADMVPGTTFTAEGRDGTDRLCVVANLDHTVADLDDCVFRSDEWFDPSTIRDVTPPEVTP